MVTVTAYVVTILSSFVYLLTCSCSFVLLEERSIATRPEGINQKEEEATEKCGVGGGTDPVL